MLRDWSGLTLRALAARAPDGGPSERTFVIGSMGEPRLNVPAQQARAINLAAALRDIGLLDRNSRTIVAGGGVAGTTFAAAATQTGATVHLIDEHEEPVVVERWSRSRYLLPNLYDWPLNGWNVEEAAVPV